MLKEALSTNTPTLRLLADCVWVYASPAKEKTPVGDVPKRFESLLSEKRPELKNIFDGHKQKWDRDRIVCLNSCFYRHVATPLFVRGLDANIVAAITYGDLMKRVYLYLDWGLFGSALKNSGAEFVWGTGKTVGRARSVNPAVRPPIVSGKVPQIRFQGQIVSFTDPNLVQMLFDGVTPRAMADIMIRIIGTLIEQSIK